MTHPNQQAERIQGGSPAVTRAMEILGGAASLIGIGGLILLMAQSAWSAPGDNPGFQGGSRTFTNPYAAPATPPPSDSFFDDEEDEPVFGDEFPQGGSANTAQGRGADTGAGGRSRGAPAGGGIQVGGTTPGGVIPAQKAPQALKVDTETAEGCKETITDFNFPDADILDIAKTLGKLVGKNFILDKDVKGRVTIISNSAITCGEAWKAFLTALDINGFALIPSGAYIRIARQRDARDKQLKTYTGEYSPDTDALITRVFPLKYLSAEEVARNFRSFMPANSRIIPYEQTNTVIVTDTGSNIAKLSKLLEILDIEGYDAGIEVITVKFAGAADLAKLIDTLIPGAPAGGAGGAPRFGGGGGGRFASRRTKEGGIINTIIADERTNSLIVHANSKGADQVRELVARLDQKLPSSAGGGRVHVLYLQFADAEQIGNTLNNLSQTSSSAPRSGGMGGSGTGTGSNPVQASLFEGAIKVSPDKATNSLVITASPSDFTTVQRVVNKLDIPRDQVYAEVVIMEVNLGRDFQFSTNVINPSNGIAFMPSTDLLEFAANPFAQKGAIINFRSGESRTLTVNGQSVQVSNVTGLIRALQTNSNANVLATPQILTLDNTEATFETSEKIPYPTTTAVQGSVSTSVSKENVSLTVTLKPQINKISNFVKLDVKTKLADISQRELPAQVKDLAFATTERNATTSIVVADQDTVVLGGLTRDNQQETVSKVPILGDIPLLGWLFKARRTTVTKTNLLIFITPTIIRQYESIRAVLDKKLRERDEFLESSTGGDDPLRKYRDNMVRGLKDVKEITSAKPVRSFTIDRDDLANTVPGETAEPAARPVPAPEPAIVPAPAQPAPPAAGQ